MPEPTIISRGRGGVHSRWPGWAVERAAWVHQQVETGYTLPEIAEQVKTGLAPGPTVPEASESTGELGE